MTALVPALLLSVQDECMAVAWEAVGESQGTAGARSPPDGQARQTSTGCKKLRQIGDL